MKKIAFDTGIKEYEVNGTAFLRFNPSDPNVYFRFFSAAEKIRAVEKECIKKAKDARHGEENNISSVAQIFVEADSKIKTILSDVFRAGNDFGKIFDGVNVVAVNKNGKRVLDSFMEAVSPIMETGIKELFAKEDAMVEKYTADYV